MSFLEKVKTNYKIGASSELRPRISARIKRQKSDWKLRVEAKYKIFEKIGAFLKDNMKKIVMAMIAAIIAFNATAGHAKTIKVPDLKQKANTVQVDTDKVKAPSSIDDLAKKTSDSFTKVLQSDFPGVKAEVKLVKQGGYMHEVIKVTDTSDPGSKATFIEITQIETGDDTFSSKQVKLGQESGSGAESSNAQSAAELIAQTFADKLDIQLSGTPW